MIKAKIADFIELLNVNKLIKAKKAATFFINNTIDFIIIYSGALGDVMYGLAYLPTFADENQNKSITVFFPDKFSFLTEGITNKNISFEMYATNSNIKQLIDSYLTCSTVSEYYLSKGIINTIPLYMNKCKYAENPDTLFQLKKILNLKHQNSLYIATSRIKNSIPFTVRKDFFILNPYQSNQTKIDSSVKEMFEKIGENLRRNGFDVLTNIGNKDQEEINNTIRLACPLQDLFNIAKKSKGIISFRSGVLDFLIPSNVNICAIYTIPSNMAKMYSLKSWQMGGYIKEIYSRDLPTIFNEIESFVQHVIGEKK